ncbi:predicted protein [Lichtheimia corymbifera JMRC:FSU:9682]|uniref:Uncharacterized protein n=1 Tax=Lichtheimia corymbifera JMRC:FSU:9682 TaxID=1263082 RepID=A0A068SG65_9FUNG|nr:predicted protein [Lichtheimia corymbifera JMRC:FSU:9682]
MFLSTSSTTSSSHGDGGSHSILNPSMLSASLADELYEEQQQQQRTKHHQQQPTFSTFINQPSPRSMASSIASALPFINSRLGEDDPDNGPAFALPKKDGSPLTMSASLTAARSMDSSSVSSSSQQRRHRKRTTTSPAMSHLSAETTWKRIQADKEREMDVLQRYYKKRANVHKQLGQLRKGIDDIKKQLKQALANEDYQEAETMQHQLETMTTKWWDLFSTVHEQLDHQIYDGWQRLATLVTRETNAATKLADASQLLREEREQQQLQLQIRHERIYNDQLQAIHEEREEIEKEQSEIAFEVEMWEQSHAEYKSRVDEIVHKEKRQKEQLMAKVQDTQNEIDELMSRLADLQQQQDEYRDEIQRLDQRMEEATREYLPEKDALEKDRLNVEERRRILGEKTNDIDRRDEELHRYMEQQNREQERGTKELESLVDQITKVGEQASQGEEQASQLVKVLETLIKARDMQVVEKKRKMTEARQRVVHQLQSVDSTRRQAYAARCHMEQQEEQLERLEAQLKSLQRHKQVAVETGQLGKAARAANQIKLAEDNWREAQSILNEKQQAAKDVMARLAEQEKEADALENTCAQIESELGSEIVAALENFKEELSNQRSNTLLERLVDLECDTLNLEIETMRKIQNFKQDINLLQIDDDHPPEI